MANMKEIALGVTSVLQHSSTPEPLPVDLWGGSANEGAVLVRVVLAECHDADIPLKVVRVPLDVWTELSSDSAISPRPRGVRIEEATELGTRIEFWRKLPA